MRVRAVGPEADVSQPEPGPQRVAVLGDRVSAEELTLPRGREGGA